MFEELKFGRKRRIISIRFASKEAIGTAEMAEMYEVVGVATSPWVGCRLEGAGTVNPLQL
jgi:hypothetical protein